MTTASSVEISEKFIQLSHGRARYLEAGAGEPVILLHGVGYTAGGDRWLLNIGPLAATGRFRVLAPDMLGWGLGDRLPIEYSFAYLVDFVRELQDALGIEKSHVVGHSMGGWIATLLAYESPNRVDKLVLVCSGGTATRTLRSMTEFNPPTEDEIRAQVESTFAAHGGQLDLERLAEADIQKTRVPGALEAYRAILRHMNEPLTRARYNTLRRLPLIKAPTLVVWGEKDEVNSVEMGKQTQQLIPGARLEVLPNCGHFVPHECPEELNRILLSFL